jgi:hypothetical protein
MKKEIIGILIASLLMLTVFPCVNASINKTDEKENTIVYESRIFGIGFVRINELTNSIKGFVIFGINDGQVISMQFINIKFIDSDGVYVGFFPPLIFFIRYNPT